MHQQCLCCHILIWDMFLCTNSKTRTFSSYLCGFNVFYSCLNGFFFSLPPAYPLLVSDHSNLPEIVSKVLTQEMQKIFVNKNLESFNEEFLKHNATSIQHQLSGVSNFFMLLKRRWCKWCKTRIFICNLQGQVGWGLAHRGPL